MQFDNNEYHIKKAIEASISRIMNATFLACSSHKPQEPDFVSQLVQSIPRDIFNTLSVYTPSHQFVVSGVFCHQKPLADMGIGKNTELGDVLIVYIEENKSSVKKCNALLLQVKKCRNKKCKVRVAEKHQLFLYEYWPSFKLINAGCYSGEVIDIFPKTLHSGAQYLLLQSPFTDEEKVGCAYPDQYLVIEKRLSEQLIDLMKFFTGRTFQIDNYRIGDDWSRLVTYLLSLSGITKYTRRNSGLVDAVRQVTFGEQSLLKDINQTFVSNADSISDIAIPCLMIYARERSNERELAD